MRVLQRTVLQNTQPGHSKFYEVNLCQDNNVYQDKDKTYAVICRWGKIKDFESDKTAEQKKIAGCSKTQALGTYEGIITEKQNRKGYAIHRTFDFEDKYIYQEIDDVNETHLERVAHGGLKPKLGDRTELLEVPMGYDSGSWWRTTGDLDRQL